jgi:hypothetical protein
MERGRWEGQNFQLGSSAPGRRRRRRRRSFVWRINCEQRIEMDAEIG